MVRSSTPDSVVLKAKGDESALIGDHLGEVKHHIVIKIVVIQEKFL